MNQMYTIFDAKAAYFMPPFMARTDAEAQRMFIQAMGQNFAYRADYNLFCIAEFNEENGVLTALDAPLIVLTGATIPEKFNPNPQPSFPMEGDNFKTLNKGKEQ